MNKEEAFDMIADLTVNSTVDSILFHKFITILLKIIDQEEE